MTNDTTSIGSSFIVFLYEDSFNNFWIATLDGGLILYNRGKNNFINFKHDPNDSTSLSGDRVRTIFEANKNLFIGFEEGIVDYFQLEQDLKPSLLKTQKINLPQPTPDTETWVQSITGLRDKKIYIGSNGNGLFKYNYFYSDLEPESLLGNIIKGLYLDKSNRIWVGSYYGGVNVYDKKSTKFQTIKAKSWEEGSISHDNVFAFTEDSQGNLWIGMDGGGIDFLKGGVKNLIDEDFQHIKILGPKTGKIENNVKCLQIDNEDNLYIGYWRGGLAKQNTKDFNVKQWIIEESKESAQDELKKINTNLEKMVAERTEKLESN